MGDGGLVFSGLCPSNKLISGSCLPWPCPPAQWWGCEAWPASSRRGRGGSRGTRPSRAGSRTGGQSAAAPLAASSLYLHNIYTLSTLYLCIQYLLDNIYTISTPASLACWSFEIVWKIKPCFHFSKLQYLHCIYTISTLYLCTISSQYLHNIYTYQHYI